MDKSESRMIEICRQIINRAHKKGVDEAEVFLQNINETEIHLRNSKPEIIKQARSCGLGIRLFCQKKLGFGSTTSTEWKKVHNLIDRTVNLAKEAAFDEYNGLPELSISIVPELRLYDKTYHLFSLDKRIQMLRDMEEAALGYHKNIINAESFIISDTSVLTVIVNSAKIEKMFKKTLFNIMCTPVAERNKKKKAGYWFSLKRHLNELEKPTIIGRKAAERAVSLLGARKIYSQRIPVVFDPLTGSQFWSSVLGAFNGESVYKNASFLTNKKKQKVASEIVTLIDNGRLSKGLGSMPFDGEGVPTRKKDLIRNGVLKNYLYNTYSSRKARCKSTGNAVRGYNSIPGIGCTNLYLKPGDYPQKDIVKSISKGLYVINLIGFGINTVTGDFSKGAEGFWIQNGQLSHPVHEVTIAGNMLEMMHNIQMIGDDLQFYGSVSSPSFLIDNVQVSGK